MILTLPRKNALAVVPRRAARVQQRRGGNDASTTHTRACVVVDIIARPARKTVSDVRLQM